MKITMKTLQSLRDGLSTHEGRLVEQELAKAAFELVMNRKDWKGPINTVVDLLYINYAPEVLAWAIAFMTGAQVTWTHDDGRWIRIKSTGYQLDKST